MVAGYQQVTSHDGRLGRRIPHPASTRFNDDGKIPPAKRLKIDESTEGEEYPGTSEEESKLTPPMHENAYSEIDNQVDDSVKITPSLPTELENTLAPVHTNKEAIEEYEAMKAAEISQELRFQPGVRSLPKGKSSIYVDAFNLALETVLEDEGHLFDEKETNVFAEWRQLDYEAQYL